MDNQTLTPKDLGAIRVTRATRRRAALATAAAAHDREDCRTLLEALGLLDPSLRKSR